MQPAQSKYCQWRRIHFLVALYNLLSEFWNRQLGKTATVGNIRKHLRLARPNAIIDWSIGVINQTIPAPMM
jgi:hypothetical protein